jgi:poly(3-hydroxybutyrate) depolymerase
MASDWPPLLVIHGRLDPVVAASNGESAVALWADAQGAAAAPQRELQRGKRYPMTVTDFRCKGRTVASLVEVARLGHAWSGGAVNQAFSDSQGPDASRMVWAFAARQFRT